MGTGSYGRNLPHLKIRRTSLGLACSTTNPIHARLEGGVGESFPRLLLWVLKGPDS